LYNANHRVVLPQAGLGYLSRAKRTIPIFLNFYVSHGLITAPKLWAKLVKAKDDGGKAVYLSSTVQQSTLSNAVNFIYKTINEEVCKLYRSTGKVDFSKIFLGGESMGSLATCGALMRSNEFLSQPLGGYYGFIGVVPSLWTNANDVKTGAGSKVPEATLAQKSFIQRTYANFMWGAADKYFPDHVNR
jgi:hypothetical protein